MTIVPWRGGAWDQVSLGGRVLPGRVADISVKPSRGVKFTKAKDSDGGTVKDEGYNGATVSLTIEIWTGPPRGNAQLDELGALLADLSPKRPGAIASPLEILHPATTAAGVLAVYITDYTIGMPQRGRLSVPITMLEWFPPEAVKPTGQGGRAKPDDVLDPDPDGSAPVDQAQLDREQRAADEAAAADAADEDATAESQDPNPPPAPATEGGNTT